MLKAEFKIYRTWGSGFCVCRLIIKLWFEEVAGFAYNPAIFTANEVPFRGPDFQECCTVVYRFQSHS